MTAVLVRPGLGGVASAVLVLLVLMARTTSAVRRRSARMHLARAICGSRVPRGSAWRSGLRTVTPTPPAWAARRLRRAGLTAPAAERAWRVGALAAGCGLWVAALVGGAAAAMVVAFLLVLVVGLVAVAAGDRATDLVDRELPLVLATVAAGVRSGASLTVAVREAAGRARGLAGEDLGAVIDGLDAGQGLVDVLATWVRARPTPGVRMAGAALALAAETGGAGARTVDGVAATLRDRLAVDRELAALSSQARASAVVIGLAPVGFVVLTAVSDPEVWAFFLRSPAGLTCLAAGCLLDAVGAGWMTAVARSAR